MIAWEPVPQFRAFLQYGMHLNNMSSLIEIRDKAVGERAGEKLTMKVCASLQDTAMMRTQVDISTLELIRCLNAGFGGRLLWMVAT